MARVRLWTLSPAERSILIIYSSELPHSWLRETTASSGPEIPYPRCHRPGPRAAWLCPAQLGNRGPNKSWKSIWLPSWRHRPVKPARLCVLFRLLPGHFSSLGPANSLKLHGGGSDPAQASQEPWFSVQEDSCASLLRPLGGFNGKTYDST